MHAHVSLASFFPASFTDIHRAEYNFRRVKLINLPSLDKIAKGREINL